MMMGEISYYKLIFASMITNKYIEYFPVNCHIPHMPILASSSLVANKKYDVKNMDK